MAQFHRGCKRTDLVLGDVDIGVHAEDTRMCDVRQTTDVLEVRVIVAVRRHVVDFALVVEVIRVSVDDIGTVELGEDCPERSTVPVVGDSTTVVTLARQVLESIVLDLRVTNNITTGQTDRR